MHENMTKWIDFFPTVAKIPHTAFAALLSWVMNMVGNNVDLTELPVVKGVDALNKFFNQPFEIRKDNDVVEGCYVIEKLKTLSRTPYQYVFNDRLPGDTPHTLEAKVEGYKQVDR